MVDRLKNVFYNLSSLGGGSPQDMVGTTVLIPMRGGQEPQQLRLKRILDTGGYGVIYQALEVRSGQEFAIKRIIAGSEQIADIKRELSIHKSVSGHPHILPFITAVSQKASDSASSPLVYLIQTELCPYGNLSSLLPLPSTNTYLSLPHIIKFFYQTVQAVSHLHCQTVPIVHRDLKVENLLLDSAENIRLCDFGSATTECHHPDATWSATQRGLLQEELARYTTPSYRAPEMLDLYSNQPIDCRADIWALGCLLYHICFLRHPFQEGSTLPILSAQYSFPPQDARNKDPLLFQSLIRSLIKTLPEERPSADGVVASLYHHAMQVEFDMEALDKVPKLYNFAPAPSEPAPPQREERPASDLKREPSPSSYYSGLNSLLGRVKGGADSLIKNIKEKSGPLLRSSSQLPILHLTTRVLISVVPDEKSGPLIRDLLDRDHNDSYLIFNLSGVYYDVTLFHGRVADLIWPRTRNTPEFLKMLDMCKQLDSWLKADPCNVVMLQDLPDLVSCVYLTTAYLLYCGLFSNLRAVGSYLTTHLPIPHKLVLMPNLRRYYNYITHLVKDPIGNVPHKKRVCIKQIRITPCSFAEDCEIVVELLCRDGVVYSSQEGEGGVVLPAENAVEFNIAEQVESDIQIRVHSPKATGFSVTTNNRTLVCTLQLYSGYMPTDTGRIKFQRKDFDSVSTSSYRLQDLAMQLTYEVLEQEFICPIESVLPKLPKLPTCCSSREECISFQQLYELRAANRDNLSQRSAALAVPPLPPPPGADVPLISIDAELSGEAGTNRPEKPARPPKPKFKDTMDESESSSSSSSDSSDSSGNGAPLDPGDRNEYESLIGQEYEFNPHFQPDSAQADSVDLIAPSEPLITTQPTGEVTQQMLQPAQVQARQSNKSPVGDDVILDLSDRPPLQPDPPAAMPQEQLISGLSELIITDTQSGIDELFTVPLHSTNQQTSADIFASNISSANIDPVMQTNGTSTKPAKSSDPWDAFNMSSLSSKSKNKDAFFENPNVHNYTSLPKEPIRQHSPKPNYMSAAFSQPQAQKREDVFGAILKDSGFPQHKEEAHTLKELNKSNLLEVVGDPDKIQVMEWSEAKQGNIRGLLSSLHEMAWEGVRWKQIGMHDLMEPAQVKKSYLRASLAFHPDKHIASPYQNLARLIVIELNEAHTRFEDGGNLQHRVF